jgi:hypothetical protein
VFLYSVESTGHVGLHSAGIYRSCNALFSCLGGPGADPTKKHQDTLCQPCVFLSRGIYRSRSAFLSSRMRNVDVLFFILGLDQCGSHKKHTWTFYAKVVLLHHVQSIGHVLCSSAGTGA